MNNADEVVRKVIFIYVIQFYGNLNFKDIP